MQRITFTNNLKATIRTKNLRHKDSGKFGLLDDTNLHGDLDFAYPETPTSVLICAKLYFLHKSGNHTLINRKKNKIMDYACFSI